MVRDNRRWPRVTGAGVEGLVYVEDFVGPEEEASLVRRFQEMEFGEVRMHGQPAKRSVLHFGWDYAYDARRLTAGEPLPHWLEPLRDRCAQLAELQPERFEQALVTRYPAGAGIGWHRDAPMFGSRIAGVSLGSACRMRFRRQAKAGQETFDLQLSPLSVYLLSGSARWSWQHSIPAAPGLRYSITFRTLRRRPSGDG